jgi:hypothetical protein
MHCCDQYNHNKWQQQLILLVWLTVNVYNSKLEKKKKNFNTWVHKMQYM